MRVPEDRLLRHGRINQSNGLALIVRSEGVGPRRGITTIDQDVAAAVAASSVEQI